MKKILVLFLCFLVFRVVFSQEGPQETKLAIELLAPQKTVLAGEPICFSAKITNEGPMAAKVVIPHGDVFGPWMYENCCKEALVAKGPGGKIRYAAFQVPPKILKPGEAMAMTAGDSSYRDDVLALYEPGHYKVWAELQSTGITAGPTVAPDPPRYEYFWKGHATSNICEIEVLAPSGVDAEAYKALKGDPLAHPQDLLAKYPSSTYAGYVLVGQGPGGSLQAASVMTPEVRDLEWHVPTAATPAKQDEWRKVARESYETFVKQARAFLCIHPDFAEQALLRRELATALFNLDKPDEAWMEVEALSKLDGQWAEEARNCLKARAQGKSQ